jgi:hypothetical protein
LFGEIPHACLSNRFSPITLHKRQGRSRQATINQILREAREVKRRRACRREILGEGSNASHANPAHPAAQHHEAQVFFAALAAKALGEQEQ